MKRIITPKRVLLALTLTLSATMAQAAAWTGNWLTSTNVGCGGVQKIVMINNTNGCTGGGTVTTVLLERSFDGGVSWNYAGTAFGGGYGTSVTFPVAVINRSGLYRFTISGDCGGATLTPYQSANVNITVNAVYTSNFKINNSTNESPTVIQTLLCKPITMDYVPPALGDNPTVTSYKLVIRSATSTGSPTGVYNSNPSGTWTSGAVPSTQNLNTGTVGTAFSAGGYFTIGLTAQTSTCTSAERVALIYVTASVPGPIANFLINNASPTSCGATLQTFQCSSEPITLTNTSSNAVSYQVDLYMNSTPNDPCAQYALKHSTGVVTTFPTDAKNLPGSGGTGTWLQSHTGNAAIVMTAYNACGVATGKTLYFKVDAAPPIAASFTTSVITKPGVTYPAPGCPGVNIPALTGLEYTDGTTSCTAPYKSAMQHTSVAAPNEVGRLNTTFDLTNITGGSNFHVTILTEKWNGSTWDNLNYLGQPENYDGIDFASLAGLVVDDPANPYYEHFLTAANGGIYRITITVSNACSSNSKTQIIKLNTTQLKTANADVEFETLGSDLFNVYPNPTSSDVSFQVFPQEKDIVSIAVYDMQGNRVKAVVSNAVGTGEEMLFKANLDELTSGMYLYKVTINNDVHTGKLSKQ